LGVSLQAADPIAEYIPLAQGRQPSCEVVVYLPAAHLVQTVDTAFDH